MKFFPIKARKKPSRKSFLKETSGNVAMIAALAILPILAVLGLAVDFQLVVTKKNTVRAILDQTLIAAARDRQSGVPQGEVLSRASDLFESLRIANDDSIECDPINADFEEDSDNLSAFVDCTQPTTISAIFGNDEFNYRVESGSTFGVGEIDVAFVFDQSLSMNCPLTFNEGFDSDECGLGEDRGETRMDALQDAATAAIGILLATNDRPDSNIRIAITGYTNAVNAGQFFDQVVEIPSNANRRPVTLENSEELGQIYEDDIIGKVQMEVGSNRQFFDYEAIFCGGGANSNQTDCNGNYSDFAGRFYYPFGEHPTCVWARQGPEAATDRAPGGNAFLRAARPVWDFTSNFQHNDDSNYFRKNRGEAEVERTRGSWRHGRLGGGSEITGSRNSTSGTFGTRGAINVGSSSCDMNLGPVPLTSDETPLLDFINRMVPVAGTGGHVGTAWGWYLLSPNWASVWPSASQPLDYNEPDTAKVLILMTDGEFNDTAPDAPSSSVEQAEALCRNIKNQTNITIFTVRFGDFESTETTSVTNESITDFCATDEDRSLSATTGPGLIDAFESIATEISDLRISN